MIHASPHPSSTSPSQSLSTLLLHHSIVFPVWSSQKLTPSSHCQNPSSHSSPSSPSQAISGRPLSTSPSQSLSSPSQTSSGRGPHSLQSLMRNSSTSPSQSLSNPSQTSVAGPTSSHCDHSPSAQVCSPATHSPVSEPQERLKLSTSPSQSLSSPSQNSGAPG